MRTVIGFLGGMIAIILIVMFGRPVVRTVGDYVYNNMSLTRSNAGPVIRDAVRPLFTDLDRKVGRLANRNMNAARADSQALNDRLTTLTSNCLKGCTPARTTTRRPVPAPVRPAASNAAATTIAEAPAAPLTARQDFPTIETVLFEEAFSTNPRDVDVEDGIAAVEQERLDAEERWDRAREAARKQREKGRKRGGGCSRRC